MSDEHRWRRKCFCICLLALFIGLIGIVLPEIDIGARTYINATNITQSGLTSFPCSLNNISNIDTLNCTGVEGSTPFYIDINFTNVTNFTNIETKIYYNALTGFSTHEVHVEIFCTNEDRFVVLERFNGENQWQYFSNDVLSYTHFIQPDGNVTIRVNHTESGISTHRVILDTVRLVNDPNFAQNIINLNQTIGGGTGSQNLSQVLYQGDRAINQTINYTDGKSAWLKIGFNNVSGLTEINTSSIFYYKQGTTFLGFTGSGFAYSAYSNRPMKFGEASANNSAIQYNTTYGTRWQGSSTGGANNNLNITGFDKVNMYQDLDMNYNNNEDVKNINMSGKIFINSTDGAGIDLNYSFESRHNNIIRTFLYRAFGIQEWTVNNSAKEIGVIAYSTPGMAPPYSATSGVGIVFYEPGRLNPNLTRFVAYNEGLVIQVFNSTSAAKGTLFINRTTGNITISTLAGSGNAYTCNNANGEIYRGNPGC